MKRLMRSKLFIATLLTTLVTTVFFGKTAYADEVVEVNEVDELEVNEECVGAEEHEHTCEDTELTGSEITDTELTGSELDDDEEQQVSMQGSSADDFKAYQDTITEEVCAELEGDDINKNLGADVNNDIVQVGKYYIIYAKDSNKPGYEFDKWYLTSDGGILQAVKEESTGRFGANNQWIGIRKITLEYTKPKNARYDTYIKSKLGVSSLNNARREDVEYVVDFCLPCKYVYLSAYMKEYRIDEYSPISLGEKWRCPLCNGEYTVVPHPNYNLGKESSIFVDVNGRYESIFDHISSCKLRDSDKYWTCDICNKKFELNHPIEHILLLQPWYEYGDPFGGWITQYVPLYNQFKECDDHGIRTIKWHKIICKDIKENRKDATWTCEKCGKTYNRYYGPNVYMVSTTYDESGKCTVYNQQKDINCGKDKFGEIINSTASLHIDEHYNGISDNVIAKYITDDMTELEKAYYLFKWVNTNLEYNYPGVYDTREFYCNIEDYNGSPSLDHFDFALSYDRYDNKIFKYGYSDNTQKSFTKNGFGLGINSYYYCPTTCAGYTEAYDMLLSKVGIESYKISGKIPGYTVDHAWNMVKIEGKFYNICSTWGKFMFNAEDDGWIIDWDGTASLNHEKDEFDKIEYDTSFAGMDIKDIYRALYGKEMPDRGFDFDEDKEDDTNSKYYTTKKIKLEDGSYIEIQDNIPYSGKKERTQVTLVAKDGNMYTSNKKGGLVVRYKNNKNAGTGIITIKKLKSNNNELNNLVKNMNIEYNILPFEVTNDFMRCKFKNGIVKSVKVMINKWKKVDKKMWALEGNNIVFSGNFTGTVSINGIA